MKDKHDWDWGHVAVALCGLGAVCFVAVILGFWADAHYTHQIIEACLNSGGEWKVNPEVWGTHYECVKETR